MKRMYVLGLFFGALMLFSYGSPAKAMPAFGPSVAKVDCVVVKAYTYRRARADDTSNGTSRLSSPHLLTSPATLRSRSRS